MLVEHVAGKNLGQLLQERIFEPFAMTQTRVNTLEAIIPNRAQGYLRIPGSHQNAPYFSPANAIGAGNLASTVDDLLKWDAALSTQKLLRAASLEMMWTPVALSKGGTGEYGFGWTVKLENGHRLVAHGGNISGFSSSILRFVDDKLTVIVLANFGGVNAEKLAQDIAGQLQPELARKLPQPIADSDPRTTEQLKRGFLGMMNGEMDPELFSEKLNRELGPLIEKGKEQSKRMSADNGALERFELIDRKTTDQGVQLKYRAVFEYRMRITVFIDLDRTGKITNWGLRGAE